MLDLYQGRFEGQAAAPRRVRVRAALNAVAEPFDWSFTSDDLAELMQRLAASKPQIKLAA